MQRNSVRPTILLTGFGPFPGVAVNASWSLVSRLAPAATIAFPGFHVEAQQLSTEWQAGPAQLIALVERTRPVVALHFGVSRRATGFVIETRGYNTSSAVVDACGTMPDPDCLTHGSPDILSAKLPAALIAQRLRNKRLPVLISRDAGRYLCNAALFHTLDLARRGHWPTRASGFIHVPTTLHERTTINGSKLTMPRAVQGGLEIIAACVGLMPVAQEPRAGNGAINRASPDTPSQPVWLSLAVTAQVPAPS
jgi:pyroglutamyl-peptidase